MEERDLMPPYLLMLLVMREESSLEECLRDGSGKFRSIERVKVVCKSA